MLQHAHCVGFILMIFEFVLFCRKFLMLKAKIELQCRSSFRQKYVISVWTGSVILISFVEKLLIELVADDLSDTG